MVLCCGATNTWLNGATSAKDIAPGAGVGVLSSVAGGVVGSWAGNGLGGLVINGTNITSPVTKGVITGVIGGAAGGYAGGFTAGMLMTGDVNAAGKAGLNGMWMGASIGGVSGGIGAYVSAKDAKINPWTGKPEKSIVIGEGMDLRVRPIANDLKSEYLELPKEMKTGYLGKNMIDPKAMDYNAQWIELKMQSDYYIYDAGPKGTTINSSFYNMEVGRTMIYPKVYNVYHVQEVTIIRVLIIK